MYNSISFEDINSQGKLATENAEAIEMENISQILQTAGTNWNQVVKATIYTTRLDWFNRINAVYGEYVKTPYPARETVGVCELPKKARIEISVVARQP